MNKMITASMMKKFVLQVGLYSYFKYSSSDLQMATYDEMTSGDGLFNMIETHPDNVIALFDMMIEGEGDLTLKAQLGNLKDICISYSNPTPEPEPEPTPDFEYPLESNPLQHNITFTIAQSLDKPEQVKVLQRYGTANDLTEWHDCTHRQVRFHQDTYSVFINACQHEVRELKIVSPVEITIIPPPQPESEAI